MFDSRKKSLFFLEWQSPGKEGSVAGSGHGGGQSMGLTEAGVSAHASDVFVLEQSFFYRKI